MVTMVKTTARAHRDLCVLAVLLCCIMNVIVLHHECYCVASCNRYLMLINHPTDGTIRGLTLTVRLLGRILKKR